MCPMYVVYLYTNWCNILYDLAVRLGRKEGREWPLSCWNFQVLEFPLLYMKLADRFTWHSMTISDLKKMFRSVWLHDVFRYGFVYKGQLASFLWGQFLKAFYEQSFFKKQTLSCYLEIVCCSLTNLMRHFILSSQK